MLGERDLWRASAAEPMDAVRAVLDRAGLAHIGDQLEEDGYDDMTYLRDCAADDASGSSSAY